MKSIFHSATEVNGIKLESDYTIDGVPNIKATTPDGEEYSFIHNQENSTVKTVSYQPDPPEAVINAIESKGLEVVKGL